MILTRTNNGYWILETGDEVLVCVSIDDLPRLVKTVLGEDE